MANVVKLIDNRRIGGFRYLVAPLCSNAVVFGMDRAYRG